MRLDTPICQLLGVEHPLGNAGMAGMARHRLAAAVAEAGGIGTIALGGSSVDEVRSELAALRELTDRPVSANFITWILEHDRSAFDAALEFGVHSVTLSFGDPSPFAAAAHDAGALVISQVQTIDATRRALDAGADVLIAQGNEAGGHTGVTPLLPFLPQVVDLAGDVPVLAAGGVGDGRGLAAVLNLGGAGALMGTRFIASDEAQSRWPDLPDQVLAASADDSVWTTSIDIASGKGRSHWPSGIGARSIRTPWLDRWADRDQELAHELTGGATTADLDGGDPTPAYAGPSAGMVTSIEPAADIIRGVVGQAASTLSRGASFVSTDG